jgi:hypothetical protein
MPGHGAGSGILVPPCLLLTAPKLGTIVGLSSRLTGPYGHSHYAGRRFQSPDNLTVGIPPTHLPKTPRLQ